MTDSYIIARILSAIVYFIFIVATCLNADLSHCFLRAMAPRPLDRMHLQPDDNATNYGRRRYPTCEYARSLLLSRRQWSSGGGSSEGSWRHHHLFSPSCTGDMMMLPLWKVDGDMTWCKSCPIMCVVSPMR